MNNITSGSEMHFDNALYSIEHSCKRGAGFGSCLNLVSFYFETIKEKLNITPKRKTKKNSIGLSLNCGRKCTKQIEDNSKNTMFHIKNNFRPKRQTLQTENLILTDLYIVHVLQRLLRNLLLTILDIHLTCRNLRKATTCNVVDFCCAICCAIACNRRNACCCCEINLYNIVFLA